MSLTRLSYYYGTSSGSPFMTSDNLSPPGLDPEREFVDQVRQVLESQLPKGKPANIEKSVAMLHAKIATLEGADRRVFEADEGAEVLKLGVYKRPSATRRLSDLWMWAATAVTTAVVLFGAVSMWRSSDISWNTDVRDYTTAAGQRTQIRLPDNTLVELNVASQLRVPNDFGERDRRVYLNGEARFVVIADGRRPFIVETETATVEDLATVFNVRAYSQSGGTSVAVTEGRVSVAARLSAWDDRAVVDANEVAVVTEDGATQVDRMLDSMQHIGWTREVLQFTDTPLNKVLAELSRWYGVDFKIRDDELAHNRVTMTVRGTILTSRHISEFAEAIDARIIQEDNSFVVVRLRR